MVHDIPESICEFPSLEVARGGSCGPHASAGRDIRPTDRLVKKYAPTAKLQAGYNEVRRHRQRADVFF